MTDQPTTRQAAEWFVRMHAEQDVSPEVLQRWLQWFEASKENRTAFEDIAAVWHSTTPAVLARHTDAAEDDDYDGSIPVAEWLTKKATQHNARALRDTAPALKTIGREKLAPTHGKEEDTLLDWLRTWRRPLVSACATALLATLALTLFRDELDTLLRTGPISSGEFTTRTGEHMQLVLADGSRVTLGGQSKLAVDFTHERRAIHLDAGEAFFIVHKDPTRPFTVVALDGAITAVGTAFNVRAIEDRVTVTVTEGTVRVSDAETPPTIPRIPPGIATEATTHAEGSDVRVKSGEQLTYQQPIWRGKRAGSLKPLETQKIKRVDADESARWRDGWLVYRDEPLKYVIADITRYTDIKVTVTDSAADLLFSGAVFKDRVAEWIVALPEVSPVNIEKDGDRLKIDTRPSKIVVTAN